MEVKLRNKFNTKVEELEESINVSSAVKTGLKYAVASPLMGIYYANKISGALIKGAILGNKDLTFKQSIADGYAKGLITTSKVKSDNILKSKSLFYNIPVIMSSDIDPVLLTVVARAVQAKVTADIQTVAENMIPGGVDKYAVRGYLNNYLQESEYINSINKFTQRLIEESQMSLDTIQLEENLKVETFNSDYTKFQINYIDNDLATPTKSTLTVALKVVIYREDPEFLARVIFGQTYDAYFKRIKMFLNDKLSLFNLLTGADNFSLRSKMAKSLGVSWLDRVKSTKKPTILVVSNNVMEDVIQMGSDFRKDAGLTKQIHEKLGVVEFFIINESSKTVEIMDDVTYSFNTLSIASLDKSSNDVIKKAVIEFRS